MESTTEICVFITQILKSISEISWFNSTVQTRDIALAYRSKPIRG